MSASSQQMAETSTDLSRQSVQMAQTIQEMADDSARLVALSAALTSGATEGVKRNQRLRALARENRERLDASARELETLVAEAQRSVAAAEALAAAFQEIREFVALMQHMARQSKMLAFSAGMEARRAGPEGAGFVVVAKEVQRLADGTAEAAERTEKVVSALLLRVEESRASSERSAAAVGSVRESTHQGLASFGLVESAVGDTEAWTAAIEQASLTSSRLVEDTTRRIAALARGVEAFAAAMQEVAASAQEQSASSAQVVGTATALSMSAERLTEQAGAFRLEGSPVERAGQR
jgi:methyl-accepting chemotaxis protein